MCSRFKYVHRHIIRRNQRAYYPQFLCGLRLPFICWVNYTVIISFNQNQLKPKFSTKGPFTNYNVINLLVFLTPFPLCNQCSTPRPLLV